MIVIGLFILILLISSLAKMYKINTRLQILVNLYSAMLYSRVNNLEVEIYNGLWGIREINSIILILLLSSTLLYIGFEKNQSWLVLILSIIGMITIISANNIGTLFLGIELQSYTLYILAAMSKGGRSAGLKYFMVGALASGFLLLGLALIYGILGITKIENIEIMLRDLNGNTENLLGIELGVFLLLVGLLIKLGSVPFHNWAPDIYDVVPTLITVWIGIFPKISICFLIYKIMLWKIPLVTYVLLISSYLSNIIGSILSLFQYRIKRLLAYSSISHLGFIFVSIICMDLTSLSYYLLQYMVTMVNVFYILVGLGIVQISHLRSNKNIFLGLSLSISLLSLGGIPPFVGFIAKLNILNSALEHSLYGISIILIITSIISASYYLKIIRLMNLEPRIIETKKIQKSQSNCISLFLLFIIIRPLFE